MEQLTRHPLSALWGDMPEDQYREFVEGIKERHIRQMIMTLDGKILDGWHRYKACLELGIEPFVAVYTEDDPVVYVIRQNANRRHLTPGQRAACIDGLLPMAGRRDAARPGTLTKMAGSPGVHPGSPPVPTVEDIAAEAGVSERTDPTGPRSAQNAAGLGEKAVRSGELSPKAAAAQAKGEPNLPKGPTPKDRLEAQVDALAMEVQEKAEENERLERALREARAQMSEYPHEREKAATEREAIISTLRSQLNEYMVRANEDSQSLRYWKREAKQPCRKCGTEWEFTND